jgi:hypothetical protein
MNKKKFIDRKLNPALANLINTINPFSAWDDSKTLESLDYFGTNFQSLDLLKNEVEASAASLDDDGKVTKSDEDLYERLINSKRDLKNLRLLLIRGISRKTEISPGIKGFGEKIGAQYGLHMDHGSKYYKGVFSGLARNLSERIPQISQRIWTYLLRFVYIGLFILLPFELWFYLAVIYFALYWAMVTSPPLTDNVDPLAVVHLITPMRDVVAAAIESALLQDGGFNGKVDGIEAELQKISSIFNTKDLTDARNISLFIKNWFDAGVSNNAENAWAGNKTIFDSVSKMAEYLERFFSTGDIGALEFAKSEFKPIENKIGYSNLRNAVYAPITKLDFDANGPDGLRAAYNNSVDLSVADHVNDFRQALDVGDYFLATYYYGCDLTDTQQKQIQENNERILAERKAAEERRIAEAAQATPPEKGSGFFSSAGKNFVGGVMLGKGLSDTFMSKPVGKKHWRCGNCRFETVSISAPNSCPKCKKYGRRGFIEL